MRHFKSHISKAEHIAQNLFILGKGGRIGIQPEDIVYLEGKINYTTLHTYQKRFIASFHLKFFGAALEQYPNFLRINKSYIINLDYLKSLDWHKTNKEAYLTDGTCLPISRRRAKELGKILWDTVNINH